MKLNPDNPVTQQMDGNWHKLVLMLMLEMGVTEFEVTTERIDKMVASPYQAVVADARAGEWSATQADRDAAARAKFFKMQATRGEAAKAAEAVKEMRAARAERRRIHGEARRAERLAQLERRRGAK